MALQQISFSVPQRPQRRSIIEELLLGTLGTVAGVAANRFISEPFERRAEERAEARSERTAASAETRRQEGVRADIRTRAELAPMQALAQLEADIVGGVLTEPDPETAQRYIEAGIAPARTPSPGPVNIPAAGPFGGSAVTLGKRLFFTPEAEAAFVAGEQPLPQGATDLYDRIGRFIDPGSPPATPTTRREAAQAQPLLAPAISAAGLPLERQRVAQAGRESTITALANVFTPLTATDLQEFGKLSLDGEPLSFLDMQALKMGLRGEVLAAEVDNPAIQRIAERGRQLQAAREEGRLRPVPLSQESLDAVMKQYTQDAFGSTFALQDAARFIADAGLLTRIEGDKGLRRLDLGEPDKVVQYLRSNGQLLEAFSLFRLAKGMNDVKEAELARLINPGPGTLGYLQLFFRQAGIEDWRHDGARYDGLPVDRNLLIREGIFPANTTPASQPSGSAQALQQETVERQRRQQAIEFGETAESPAVPGLPEEPTAPAASGPARRLPAPAGSERPNDQSYEKMRENLYNGFLAAGSRPAAAGSNVDPVRQYYDDVSTVINEVYSAGSEEVASFWLEERIHSDDIDGPTVLIYAVIWRNVDKI